MSERNKILTAMVRLSTFTVQELIDASKSKESTVRTVLRRFDSTKLEFWTESHRRVPGGQVKTYRLNPEGRQSIKDELKQLLSSFVSYADFKEREGRGQEFAHASLNAAIEGLEKLKSKKTNKNYFDERVIQTFKDLDRAKKYTERAGLEKDELRKKISTVMQELQKLQSECRDESTKNRDHYRYVKWSDISLLASANANAEQKNSYAMDWSTQETNQQSKFYSNRLSSFRSYRNFQQYFQVDSKRNFLKPKIYLFNNVVSEENLPERKFLSNNTLTVFKKNIRQVASSLEVIKSSPVSQAMPEIYVCSAMRDKYSRSLATHIQGRFDTFLDEAHATKRIDPASVENGDILHSNGNIVVIVTLNSSGPAKDLENAISKIKRIQSQFDFGVVVADQSEGFERLGDANISRENYWPKARDSGFEAIMQYTDE